jgi:hypothetical protein
MSRIVKIIVNALTNAFNASIMKWQKTEQGQLDLTRLTEPIIRIVVRRVRAPVVSSNYVTSVSLQLP